MRQNKYFIDRMNPLLKIFILLIITIISSIDFYPFLSGVLVISCLIVGSIFSSLSFKEIMTSIKAFVIMSIGFMGIILITRYISKQDLELLRILGLGFRIILVGVYTTIFVKTTDPTELVMVFIKYFKIPAKYGYPLLTAYRFLPTFKDEMEIIKYAHQVRGIKESKNPVIAVWNSKRYIIPMLATAIRKGVRISISMETRAFGKYSDRTYYRQLALNKREVITSLAYSLYIFMLMVLFYSNNLTDFTLFFKD